MSLGKEFKEFIMRGNVMDMAVGVIVGSAFGKIVTSLVDDIVMPIITLATGKVNFTDLFVALDGSTYKTLAEAKENGASVFAYGNFIQQIVQFLIIALCIFAVIKAVNKLKRPEPEAPKTTKICPFCKSEVDKEATKCAFCASELKD